MSFVPGPGHLEGTGPEHKPPSDTKKRESMTFATSPLAESRPAAHRLQDRDPRITVLLAILLAITLARLIALFLSPSELGFDEAQYWAWSRHLSFGYFTKPPMIAWVIAAETRVCGNGAACVRAASPIFHCATALVLAVLANRLYGRATGFWTGIFYILMPGIAVSSFLITTDVFLLFFWSVALLALVFYLQRPGWGAAVIFGLACGLGLYAKYAMIYLPIMVLLAAIAIPSLRGAIFRWKAAAAFILIALIIAPNLWWNYAHQFATFEHTGDNIGWSLARLNATKGLGFFLAQFGVAGPVVFGAMINALVLGARSEKPEIDRLLLWLSWPVIITITIQGFLSRANANWAATAYPAGVVLATALVIRHRWRFFFVANLLVCGLVSVLVLWGTATLDPLSATGPARQLRQLGGWSTAANNLAEVAEAHDAQRVVIEGRALTAGMIHALREKPLDVLAFLPDGTNPGDQFQLDQPWRPGDATSGTLLRGLSSKAAARLGAHRIATIDAPLYSNGDGRMEVYGFGPE